VSGRGPAPATRQQDGAGHRIAGCRGHGRAPPRQERPHSCFGVWIPSRRRIRGP
jgi:hypothetical protein